MDLSSEILGCDDLRRKEVKVPQWGKTLTIQEMGLQESLQSIGSIHPDENGQVTLSHLDIAQVVAYGVIDPETGERVFSDADVPKLARKNRAPLMLLYTEITALSGSVEEEAKN